MRIYTHWDPPPRRGEVNNEPSRTERKGYVDAKRQIIAMREAGLRLQTFRERDYDFVLEKGQKDVVVPDDASDPTRDPGFDLADASMLQRAVVARQTAIKPVEDPPAVVPAAPEAPAGT